jgi:methylase of polypeptide subunit release factors
VIDKTSLSHITQGPLQIKIEIEKWMDGGGLTFGQEVADVVQHLFPNKTHDSCLDWCSGPGTIGFELLGRGLINNLVLMDINGEVIKRAKKI